ncbi:DUF3379 family protein [Aeromonas australiensis]|uniref:DUF3379 family protein n=1 Tax=Aeromonas australiensis TaxID=1114880 RepID=UPI00058A032C|nr:DUF3379 family protein [Aeromonas australiensis]
MDELEFRRNAMIQPDDQQPDFLSAANASQNNQHYLEEMKRLDRALHKAMAVEVPAGLAERILLRQALYQDDSPSSGEPHATAANTPVPSSSGTSWSQLAMAASVAFLLGMSTRWLTLPTESSTPPSLAQIAMAHVYEEAPFIAGIDEGVNLHNINSKMEKYGATMSGMDGLKVTYVNHCAFYQGPALHMVIEGEMGPVTLFLVPKHVPLSVQPRFEDGTLKGEIVPLKGANMVLIGQMKESLEPVSARLKAKLHWSI